MSIREILRFPNPILRQVCRPVDSLDPAVAAIVQDLWDTLDSHVGVGLSAPQIGYPVRIAVVDATRARRACKNHGRTAILNPTILLSEGKISFREGCMSVPDLVAYIKRAERVTLSGTLPDGRPVTLTSEGFEAVIFQHEIDHLDGILFIDHVQHARDLKPRPT